MPFLMFRYHIGPPILTIVLVTHSRSVRGILNVFKIISAERVGRGLNRCLKVGRKGRISLGSRFALSVPISRTWILGTGPLEIPSRTMIPAVRIPSYKELAMPRTYVRSIIPFDTPQAVWA